MNIIEQLRAGHVRRWHIVAMAREQTVAEHTFRVVCLTEHILRILGRFDWDESLTLNAMRLAHVHDRHEYILGDIPTPGKALIQRHNIGVASPVEQAARQLDPEYAELMDCCDPGSATAVCPLAGQVVKLADLLEAMNWIGLFGVGSHAAEVWISTKLAALKQLELVCPDGTKEQGPLLDLCTNLAEGRQFK